MDAAPNCDSNINGKNGFHGNRWFCSDKGGNRKHNMMSLPSQGGYRTWVFLKNVTPSQNMCVLTTRASILGKLRFNG